MRFNIITVVWGDAYVKTFLNMCLPSLLAPGNIPALSAQADCVFTVITSAADKDTIASSPLIYKTAQIMPTRVTGFNNLFDNKDTFAAPISLSLMTWCHSHAVIDANERDAAMIFISPDSILSGGALDLVYNVASSGKRAVMAYGLCSNAEAFTPKFTDSFKNKSGYLSASPAAAMKLALECLHSRTISLFTDSDSFTHAPAQMIWPVAGEGLLARCLFLHPLMIYPRDKRAIPMGAIDTDFLVNALPDYKDYYVIKDSDELSCIELSGGEKSTGKIYSNSSRVAPVAKYISFRGSKIHRRFLKEKIRLHSGPLSSKWESVERTSDKFINKALMLQTFL